MLVIDCCIRGELSSTRKYYRAFLAALPAGTEIEVIELSKLGLVPLDEAAITRRDSLLREGKTGDSMFALARRFRDADEILIAAPFWDLSFPSLLKVFFEHISVSGLTFRATEQGMVGLCRAKKLYYFSTCGGYVGERHEGFEYTRKLSGMLGITDCEAYTVEGLDILPEKREAILAEAIRKLKPRGKTKEG